MCNDAFGGAANPIQSGAKIALDLATSVVSVVASKLPIVGGIFSAVSTIWSAIDGSYSTNNAKDIYACIAEFVQESIDTSLNQYDGKMTNLSITTIKREYDVFFEVLQSYTECKWYQTANWS